MWSNYIKWCCYIVQFLLTSGTGQELDWIPYNVIQWAHTAKQVSHIKNNPLLLSFPILSYPLSKTIPAPILFFLSTSFFLSFFLCFFFYFFKNHVKNRLSQMLYIARSIFLHDILCVFLIVFPMFIFLNFWNCYKFSFEIVKKWLEKDISL